MPAYCVVCLQLNNLMDTMHIRLQKHHEEWFQVLCRPLGEIYFFFLFLIINFDVLSRAFEAIFIRLRDLWSKAHALWIKHTFINEQKFDNVNSILASKSFHRSQSFFHIALYFYILGQNMYNIRNMCYFNLLLVNLSFIHFTLSFIHFSLHLLFNIFSLRFITSII